MIERELCTPDCWMPHPCPDHGTAMAPRKFNDPLACCDKYRSNKYNKRHLWDAHDSGRRHVDRYGWEQHLESCEPCRKRAE